jgi:hypothetical protein
MTLKEEERERRRNLRKIEETFNKPVKRQGRGKAVAFVDGEPDGINEVYLGLRRRPSCISP